MKMFTRYTKNKSYSNSDMIPSTTLGSTLRPNMDEVINLKSSSRRLVTNERGWRVEKPKKTSYQSSIMVSGCSWAEGVHEDWGGTYSSVIERAFKINVANIGVGSYGLIQIIKRIKNEIDFVNPKIIVISYLSGHVDRCFKYNAATGLIHRPIYKITSDNEYQLAEPVILPIQTFNYLSLLSISNKKLTIMEKSILFFSQKVMTLLSGSYVNKYITKEYISPLKNNSIVDTGIRRKTLSLFLSDLESICAEKNCTALLCGLPDVIGKEKNVKLVNNKDDNDIINLLSSKSSPSKIKYVHSSNFVKRINSHVLNEAYYGNVWALDNNHPNAKGYRIIGEVIVESIKKLKTIL